MGIWLIIFSLNTIKSNVGQKNNVFNTENVLKNGIKLARQHCRRCKLRCWGGFSCLSLIWLECVVFRVGYMKFNGDENNIVMIRYKNYYIVCSNEQS